MLFIASYSFFHIIQKLILYLNPPTILSYLFEMFCKYHI